MDDVFVKKKKKMEGKKKSKYWSLMKGNSLAVPSGANELLGSDIINKAANPNNVLLN